MNELKVVARIAAQERGEAVALTRERPYALSDRPLVMIPIVMAGESPVLFALGIGDGRGRCRVHVCAEPRDRDQQYAMLRHAAADMQAVIDAWQANPGLYPQIITSSRDASRICLATIHRMTFAQQQPDLRRVGRALHWLNRMFERSDSAAVLNMPEAICALYATGQDDHADAHLGAVLEWLKPADGQIYDRIIEVESQPASTATDPRLDNEKLVPLVEALGKAEESGNRSEETRLRGEIERVLQAEVQRRHGLIRDALAHARRFPASSAAFHVQSEDRAQFDRHLAYVVDPANQLAAGLSGDAATGEFLSRELNADHVEGLAIRSVSAARGSARLAGDVLVGEVTRRRAWKISRTTTVEYRVRSRQDRLAIRRGDKLALIGDETFVFTVLDAEMGAAGETTVTLELTAGKTKAGQPAEGDEIELAEPLGSMERISRTMRLAYERMRSKPAAQAVTGRPVVRRDYLAGVRALRRNA